MLWELRGKWLDYFLKQFWHWKLGSIYELVSSQNDMISVEDVDKRGEQNIV